MQEEGVQEIGSAVMQLNDTTQRNAAASKLATTAEVVAERARDWRPAVLLQTARDQAAGNPSLTGLNRP
jgi:methyl-accepting chemotaxis protein